MKILRVASDLYPYVIGGVGVHVHEMSTDQVIDGDDVTIYTCLPHHSTQMNTVNYTIVNFGRHLEIIGNTICLNMLPALICHLHEYDIIHAHGFDFFSTLLCAIAKRIKKCRMVLTIHGIDDRNGVQRGSVWFANMYASSFGRFVFSSADAVLTYTEEEKAVLIKKGIPSHKIKVIHNGIHVERFQQPIPVPKKKQILWVGRHVPGKGCQYLIEGFAEFSKHHPDYTLLMIGRGPDHMISEQFIEKLSLSDKISLVDFVPNDKLPEIYVESELFILSSLSEGVPRTILEAMACGLPIISTELPQLRSIIDGCGILIPCEDSKAITNALEQMIANPELMKNYGKNGREKVLSCYDWKYTVEMTNKVFESLIAS